MNKLINVNSHLNVEGWSREKVREAAEIFLNSVDECSYIGDIGLQDGYHYLCFIHEAGEIVVFVANADIIQMNKRNELTEEEVFCKANEEFIWDGKSVRPPVNSICQTHLGKKVKVIAYTHINERPVVVVQDYDERDEIDWVMLEVLQPVDNEKASQIRAIATEILNSVNLKGEDFAHLEMEVAEYLYDSGLRFVNKKEEDEDDSY